MKQETETLLKDLYKFLKSLDLGEEDIELADLKDRISEEIPICPLCDRPGENWVERDEGDLICGSCHESYCDRVYEELKDRQE